MTKKNKKLTVVGLPMLLGIMMASQAQAAEAAPWRLQEAAGLPEWISLSGTFRIRYEGLHNQFRALSMGNDQIVALRTTLLGELHFDRLTLGAEFIDSRAYLDDNQTSLSTSIVDAAELLQGYAALNMDGMLGDGTKSTLKAGRITIDMGSRRLVARNRYRNTINAFTGAEWNWSDKAGHKVQAFVTVPVDRRPTASAKLDNNDVQFDKEDFDTVFGGVNVTLPVKAVNAKLELYALGLHEDDSPKKTTANRRLVTPGFRFYRGQKKGQIDFQIETVLQFGKERASKSATDLTDLDVFAYFAHGEVGYTFAKAWSPRVILQYDYASGNKNPSNNKIGRFDTLYGARRFDFGPTGIYGPFARGNLSSPGLRTEFAPTKGVGVMAALRGFWLASRYDSWSTAKISDPIGASGRYLGTQIEGRLRWTLLPGNLQFEAGLAHIFQGSFPKHAPNANGEGSPTYGYTQMVVTF